MVGVTGVEAPGRARVLIAFLAALTMAGASAAGADGKDAARDPEGSAEVPSCLDVGHFAGVVATGPKATAILYLVKAVVRDDGRAGTGEPADIELVVLGGRRFDALLNRVRLYGPLDRGLDGDGSRKLEWSDDTSLRYNGFGLAALDRGRKIRLIAMEADHQPTTPRWIRKLSARSAVFDGVVDLEALPWGEVVRVDGTCDRPGRCMTLWLARENGATGGTGRYWKCP